VVCGWSRIMLAAAYDSHGTHHARAARFIVDVVMVAGHGCGLLAALLVPPLAALVSPSDILDDGLGQCFRAAAWGQVKLGCLIADGTLGGDVARLLGGIFDGAGR
jgi:hypothetical protein